MQALSRFSVLARDTRAGTARRGAAGAESALAKATAPALWVNPGQIVAPSYGTSVFTEVATALTDLEHASGKGLGVDRSLVAGAAGELARQALQQADGSSASSLALGRQQLGAGDRQVAAGHLIPAVRAYEQAWAGGFAALTQLAATEATGMPASALGAAAASALGSRRIALAGPEILHNPQPLTLGGKPELFFGGSEACPFCAVERWGMIVALSQFGTFSHLSLMQSDPTDGPSVRTFTFLGSSYQSPYISFVGLELRSNVRKGFKFEALQHPTNAQRALMDRFDPTGQVPFIDVANRFVNVDSTIQPGLIQGMSWSQIGGSLTDPSSIPAQAIGGEAEVLTAEVCEATGGEPSAVCSAPQVTQYETALPSLTGQGGACPATSRTGARRQRRQPPLAGTARCITK